MAFFVILYFCIIIAYSSLHLSHGVVVLLHLKLILFHHTYVVGSLDS